MAYRTIISPWLAEWVAGDSQHELKAEIRSRISNSDISVCENITEFSEELPTADILVTNRLPEEYYDSVDQLEWIQTVSAGLGKYDLDRLEEQEVIVTNASGVHAQPIAEHILTYMLVFERDLTTGLEYQEARQWVRYQPGELSSKTVCIVGLGAIGSRIAQLADAVGMTVVGSRSNPGRGHEHVSKLRGPDRLDELLAVSDYIVLACPLTPATEGLIGEPELVSMKKDSILLNIARGNIVDEEALVFALRQGRISGAALDVTTEEPLPEDSELWGLPNVLLTPHVSGLTPHYWERLAEIFATNYKAFSAGTPEEMENRTI